MIYFIRAYETLKIDFVLGWELVEKDRQFSNSLDSLI